MSRDGSSADHRKSFVRACFKITVARLNTVEGRGGQRVGRELVGKGQDYYIIRWCESKKRTRRIKSRRRTRMNGD